MNIAVNIVHIVICTAIIAVALRNRSFSRYKRCHCGGAETFFGRTRAG